MPGEAGIWLFIFGDMLIFSLFFGTFLVYRISDLEVFVWSHAQLNQTYGLVNTFLMLTSSWFVATGVKAARRNIARVAPLCFVFAFICGFGFAVIKFFEYGDKIRAGITLNTNEFFICYYMFTGIHLMHVFIGMGVLAFLANYSRSAALGDNQISNIESGASFWHVVDLLWIVLFALFLFD